MCIIVERCDLGPADALLDLSEGLLVLRPTLTRPEQVAASRKALRAAGVRQSVLGVTCRCGGVLTMPPTLDASLPRLSRALSLVAAGVVALLVSFVSLPEQATATADPYDTHRWHTVSSTVFRGCAYDGPAATCSSDWGQVRARAWREGLRAEYVLEVAGQPVTLRVFASAGERDMWIRDVRPYAVAVGERSAVVGPGEVAAAVRTAESA